MRALTPLPSMVSTYKDDGLAFAKMLEDRCPSLSSYIIDMNAPSKNWPWYDCRGYVFASGVIRIGIRVFSIFGHDYAPRIDQVKELIFADNGYCHVPAKHTGGHPCTSK